MVFNSSFNSNNNNFRSRGSFTSIREEKRKRILAQQQAKAIKSNQDRLNTIKKVEELLKKSQTKEKSVPRSRLKIQRAETSGYVEALQKLKQGQNLNLKDINKYVSQKRVYVRSRLGDEPKISLKSQPVQITASLSLDGNVETIKTTKGGVTTTTITTRKIPISRKPISKAPPSLVAKRINEVTNILNLNTKKDVKLSSKAVTFVKSKQEELKNLYMMKPGIINEIKPSSINKIKTNLINVNSKLENLRQKAIKGDKNAKAAVLGVASLPTNLIQSGWNLIEGIISMALSPKETLIAVASLTASDIKKGGVSYGAKLQAGKPSALTDIAILKIPIKTPPLKPLAKKINKAVFSQKELNTISNQIKSLSKKKSLSRAETQTLQSLRALHKVDKNLVKIKNDLVIIDRQVSKTKKLPKKQLKKVVKLETKVKKQVNTKQNLKKKVIKVAPVNISKKLNELFKLTTVKSIKVKLLKLPTSETTLVKMLLDARKVSGASFKKLKTRIKKEQGLNVVQRKQNGKLSYKLLSPKQQRKKGKVKQKEKIIKITGTPKKKPIVKLGSKSKQKQIIDISKELKEQGIIAMRKPKWNKKAQQQFKLSFRKYKKKKGDFVKKVKREVREYKQGFKREITQAKKSTKGLTKEFYSKPKIKSIERNLKELDDLVKLELKEIIKLRKLTKNLVKLGVVSVNDVALDIDNMLKLAQDQRQAQDQINKLKDEFDNPLKRIRKPVTTTSKKITSRPPIKPPKSPKPPKPPKLIEKPIKKIPKLPKPPKKIIKKPIKKTRKPKLRKINSYDIKYRERGKYKTLNVNLPKNAALQRAINLIDNTTSRSMQLTKKGKTTKKDIKTPTKLNKFRIRRGKKALILVEKSKYTIDSRGEKKGLKVSKLLKRRKTKV